MKNGAKVDERSKEGWTPLMYAARFNANDGVITALITNGAAVDSPTTLGWTH